MWSGRFLPGHNGKKELAMERCGGRVFQAEGTANVKALRQE